MKPIISAQEAAGFIPAKTSLMIGGFMAVGSPLKIIAALEEANVSDLEIICNDTGLPDKGCGRLVTNHQVAKVVASHIGLNPETGKQMNSGEIEVELVPQGTLIERIRSAGAGLGGVLTPTGVGTIVEENKQKLTIQGKEYLLEEPLAAQVAIIKASIVDKAGNCIFNKTTKNFNPVMATAADLVIVEADKVVEVAEIDPDRFMLPGTFIDYIVQ
ncbi:3-oxoacid CoA-transferase subunit A [Breoghania sp.]|uniref:CoA transferase subunit A n=1 Tax=Breoghania sp. TaxID=2065378 RepID=UPI0029C9BC13|nr:3-oxoacid CoA-transferase subunit A [Breoghania sp.]